MGNSGRPLKNISNSTQESSHTSLPAEIKIPKHTSGGKYMVGIPRTVGGRESGRKALPWSMRVMVAEVMPILKPLKSADFTIRRGP